MKYKYRILLIPILLFILLFGLFIKAPTPQDYPFYDNKVNYRYLGDNNGRYSRFYDMTINILNFNKTRNTYEFTFEIYYRNLFNDTTYSAEVNGAEGRPIFHNKFYFTDTSRHTDIVVMHRIIKASSSSCSSGYSYNLELSYLIRFNWIAGSWGYTYFIPYKCNLPPPAYNNTIVQDVLFFYNFSSNQFRGLWYLNNSLIHDTGLVSITSNNQRLLYYQLYNGKNPPNTIISTGEYASRYEHYYTRVYTKRLSTLEIQQNFYNPFYNYTKDRLLLDYTIGYIDTTTNIWKNKMNDYNSNYFPEGRPWLLLINFKPKSMLMEELTTTITISQITTTSYITTITEIRDTTNYYCASLLLIPFAFGLLMYFVERRLILIGIGLGFIFLNIFLGISYAYFLLGIFLMFLNVILLRYQVIEKD
jgi:hypothetical protein